MKNLLLLTTAIFVLLIGCKNQRRVDETYQPAIKNPVYEKGQGPLIYIDEAHNNYHTKEGLYSPLAKLLTADGYRVEALKKLTVENLNNAKILIIANAMPENHRKNTSAFSDEGVEIIMNWIENGGRLFFIADHMPCPEAAIKLADALDLNFINCYAIDTAKNAFEYFNKKDSTLTNCKITQGRDSSEEINSVVSFTGQAFGLPEFAIPVLRFSPNYVMAFPERPWQFNEKAKYIPITNEVQGAILEYGKGKVAVFGEASMFTAQISENKMQIGFGYPHAGQNEQFALNIIHWLDGIIE
jgi:hypothetical protein